MPTVREARRHLAQSLLRAGSASPGLDARLLVEGSLGADNADPDTLLPAEARARLDDFAVRRLAGEPVWRILGEREFWGLPFRLSPATLEPRPDSETIVEAALAHLAGRRGEAAVDQLESRSRARPCWRDRTVNARIACR